MSHGIGFGDRPDGGEYQRRAAAAREITPGKKKVWRPFKESRMGRL